MDISDNGIGLTTRTSLTVGLKLVVRGNLGDHRADFVGPATVTWCTEKADGNFHAGLSFGESSSSTKEDSRAARTNPLESLDLYEVMQLSPNADSETIARVYRILAQRYHPDDQKTGDREMFLRLTEAYRTLSNPELRAKYDVEYGEARRLRWKIFDQAEVTKGPEGERRKRQGILQLLYAKTLNDPEHAVMTVFEFEELLGCPREHLESALWYLKGKGYVKRGDNGRYEITVSGFDEAENNPRSSEHQPALLEAGNVQTA